MAGVFRVFLCVIVAGLAAGAIEANRKAPVVEKKASAISGWGDIVDPDGDCSVKGDREKVTIAVPQTLHSLSSTISLNAPRVLQEIEGDFTATVKVTGDFKPGEKATKPSGYPFNGAGLLIWDDDKNFIRLERNVWWNPDTKMHYCYPPLFQYFKGGEEQDTCPPGTAEEFFKGRSTYLRLARKGDKVAASYSHDGKEWTAVSEISVDQPRKVSIGVAAVNSSDKPFTVEFEEFKVAAGK